MMADSGGGGGLKCKCGEYVHYTGGLEMEYQCDKCKEAEMGVGKKSVFQCLLCNGNTKITETFKINNHEYKYYLRCDECGFVFSAGSNFRILPGYTPKGFVYTAGGGRETPGGKGGGGLGEGCYVGTGGGKRGTEEMTMDDFIKMAHEITLKLGGKTITYATAHSWGMGESIKLHFTDNTVVEICPEHDEGFRFDYEPTEE